MPIWNPWHGCHKISAGCGQCYVFREDAARSVVTPTTTVRKTAAFRLPVRRTRKGDWKFPAGTHFWLCFTSDLFIEEADEWRADIWDIIRQRNDCHFTFFTKRIDRMQACLPADWGAGWDNVTVGCTVENQDRADYRLPILFSIPMRHRYIVAAPMLGPLDVLKWLNPDLVEGVSVGGESGKYAHPLDFEWVKNVREQCIEAAVPFMFHQTGSYLIKDGRTYHIPRQHQHSQAAKAFKNTASGQNTPRNHDN